MWLGRRGWLGLGPGRGRLVGEIELAHVGAAVHVVDAVRGQVVADELPHHLRGRAVLARAQALEGCLLVGINEQREACGLEFHGPSAAPSRNYIACTCYTNGM